MEHNLYHWLVNRLELATELDSIFHGAFLEAVDEDDDKSYLELMEEFPGWVAEHVSTDDYNLTNSCDDVFCEATGIYNEGNPLTVNTYNGEDMLSQTIQYTYFTWNREPYIVLMIHGGADVRGGYTKPRVFRVDHDDETAIFDNAKGHIYCTRKDHHPTALKLKEFQESQLGLPGINTNTIDFDCDKNWYTDDSCNFYPDDYCGIGYVNLEDMECVDLQAEIDEHEDEILEVGSIEPGSWRPGVVCVLDGKAYCPDCGALLAGGE